MSVVVLAQADAVNLAYHQGQMPRALEAIKALGPALFGDRVNLYDGSFSFEQTDVSLPGNSALPVAVSRKWTARAWFVRGALADWDLETPRIQGTFADPEGWGGSAANRCTGFVAPPGVTRGSGIDFERNRIAGAPTKPLPRVGGRPGTGLPPDPTASRGGARDFQSWEYWSGTYVVVPGLGSHEVLKRASGNALAPTDGSSYPLVTAQNWQIGCLSSLQNAGGEGFIALAPDGTSYRFDWHATRPQSMMRQGDAVLARNDHFVMATEVTDRFGNWVRYAYDPAKPMNLTRIEAHDGRVITLAYANGRVSTVFDGTRTWAYQYAANGDLRFVVLPDQSRWSLDMRPMVYPENIVSDSGPGCEVLPFAPGGTYTGRMTHPSGATGTFTSSFAVHGRTNVLRSCPTIPGTSVEDSPIWPKSLVVQGLTQKEISGPGMSPMVWQFGIGNDPWGAWAPCTNCASNKVTTVTEPNGSVTRHTFGIRWRENEGQLLMMEEGAPSSSGLALRTTTYNYRNASGQQFADRWGDSELFTGDLLTSLNRPQEKRVVVQQGATFTWQVDLGPSGFDSFAKPARSAEFSSLGFTRSTQTLYENNLAKWVLGQVKQLTDLGSGLVPQAHEYDAATALRTRSYAFGLLKARYGYHADGTLHTLADAVNPPTVLTNYWRGVPHNVALPDGSTESAVVNNLGLLTAHTNAAGTTTAFGYDSMGRLATISYPTEGASSYATTVITHQQVPTSDRGLELGHWRQTIAAGNAISTRYFDALWRERLRYEYDAANEAPTSSAVETRYDTDSRKVFESYQQRSLGNVNAYRPGHAWAHDALDRVLAHTQDSELGALTTTTEYLGGFAKRVTNPRGYATVFSHQAFDQPIEDYVATIIAPLGVTVSIDRDVFGKPRAITRAGGGASATRSYVYDAQQRLCKTVEPETGATIQTHDAAGNMAWRASGQTFTATAPGACDQGSVASGGKVSFDYDTRNRLTSTSFGDGQPGISRSYTADGFLQQIVASSFTWTYSYNNRRLLTQEALSVPGQTPGTGWNFTHGIDVYGNRTALTDPWGTMNYATNALGRATQVSGYASQVSYHPNGAVAGYTLANGIARTMTQNLRGLPASWQDAGVMDDSYTYDANGNVTGIQDLLQGVNTRSMGYDALDRLTAANGPWGTGQLGYDALDNLAYSQLGTRTLTHHIDAATNRLGSLSGSQSMAMGYDANGNLSTRAGQSYSFDISNRLRTAWGKATYDYDGHGRRSWVVFADGSTQLNAYSDTGTAGQLRFSAHSVKGNTRYVYLGGKLIAEANSQTGTSFSHTDALGSPVARTNASGAVTERTRYEPFGTTVAGSTNPTGIGFTGHVNDVDTGLVYMQQRYYDPIAGRFLSVDPVVTDAKTGGSFNRYVYGNNNPYKYKDPDGRFAETLWDIASLALSVNEFRSNPSIGNALGVAVDAAAVIIPGIPGGVGAIRSATSTASSAVQAVKLEKSLASEAQTAKILAGKGEAIAGAGTKTEFRDAGRVAAEHGGQAKDWSKVSGGNHVAKDGTKIETHALENKATGQIQELKTKLKDEGQK